MTLRLRKNKTMRTKSQMKGMQMSHRTPIKNQEVRMMIWRAVIIIQKMTAKREMRMKNLVKNTMKKIAKMKETRLTTKGMKVIGLIWTRILTPLKTGSN